jgi:hypothetical protein
MPTDTSDPTRESFLALRRLQHLRDIQRANAAFSATTGAAMAATSGWLSRQVDLPRALVVVLGIGLIGWSAVLVVVAVQRAQRLVPASRLVAAGDAAWVLGSIVVTAVLDLTAVGTALVLGTAAVVAAFAAGGLIAASRVGHHDSGERTEILFRSVVVAAPPPAAWQMVLDADLYARLAPNLTEIVVAPDECARTCTDTRGHTWSEAMRLDHLGRVQHIDVDVTEHPMPVDHLAATISVVDDPAGSRIDIAFTYATEMTLKGLATSLVLPVLGPRLLRPITSGWERHAASPPSKTSPRSSFSP